MEKYCVYVVLTRTGTIISKLIHFIKNDEYTHASISLDKELNQMYSFGRKYVNIPFIGTFNKEEIDKGLYGFYKTVPCIILEIEVTKEQYENVSELISHFVTNKDRYKYNYMGLFYNLFNKSSGDGDRFLCSEFVYHVLKETDIADLDISRCLVRPQNLLDIKSRVVYQGNLKYFDRCGSYKELVRAV